MKSVYRLKSTSDFGRLFRHGARGEFHLFRIVSRPNSQGHPRFAFVAPKAVSKLAVRRNLLRRRASEWARKQPGLTKCSVDLAVLFKKEALGVSAKKFYEELERAFSRAIYKNC